MRVVLVVRRHCITQVDASSKQPLADYCYKDIEALIKVGRLGWMDLTACPGVGSPEIAVCLQRQHPTPPPAVGPSRGGRDQELWVWPTGEPGTQGREGVNRGW